MSRRTTQTTALGTYEFVNINQGLYVVEIDKEGFGGYKTQPFEVAARQTVRIDAELRPAGVQQAVQIIDSAPPGEHRKSDHRFLEVESRTPAAAICFPRAEHIADTGHRDFAGGAEGVRQ